MDTDGRISSVLSIAPGTHAKLRAAARLVWEPDRGRARLPEADLRGVASVLFRARLTADTNRMFAEKSPKAEILQGKGSGGRDRGDVDSSRSHFLL